MAKNITPDQIRTAVHSAHNAGINVKLFLIHGYPGEDLASSRETIALLRELAPVVERVSLFRFVPLPGTYVYEHAEEFGVRGTDRDPSWKGDWGRYHIHHNRRHWWGTSEDFAAVEKGYRELSGVIQELWPDRQTELAGVGTS